MTTLSTYKRFQQSYAERKSPKYKNYSTKPTKKEYELLGFGLKFMLL